MHHPFLETRNWKPLVGVGLSPVRKESSDDGIEIGIKMLKFPSFKFTETPNKSN